MKVVVTLCLVALPSRLPMANAMVIMEGVSIDVLIFVVN